MGNTAAPHAWLSHPLAGVLARFNVLPSLFIHPGRAAGWPAGRQLPPAVHRHWSAALLASEGLEPVLGLDEPAISLALLPPDMFARLTLLCGIRLNAQHIRRAIARTDVELLRAQLGEAGLAAARIHPASTRPTMTLAGVASAPDWSPMQARELCEAWGAGLLARAFDGASPALARRAALRLPDSAAPVRARLAAAGMQAEGALALAHEHLNTLDPSWLCCFPGNH